MNRNVGGVISLLIKDIYTTFYGKKEFSIRDCNGYILTFAGSI